MTEQRIKYYLSSPRFNVYLAESNNDFSKAYQLYKINIELSEAFYPVLSVLEVSLRNAINEALKLHFKDPYWFRNNLPAEFSSFVSKAIQKLAQQNKSITADRVIAELNFGFWNKLFDRHSAGLLWKPLRLVFQNAPKHLRQRDIIFDMLHRIRRLRNRIYHYEPIFGDLQGIEDQYNEIVTFLTWLDIDLPNLVNDIDRMDEILRKARTILN